MSKERKRGSGARRRKKPVKVECCKPAGSPARAMDALSRARRIVARWIIDRVSSSEPGSGPDREIRR